MVDGVRTEDLVVADEAGENRTPEAAALVPPSGRRGVALNGQNAPEPAWPWAPSDRRRGGRQGRADVRGLGRNEGGQKERRGDGGSRTEGKAHLGFSSLPRNRILPGSAPRERRPSHDR